MDDYGAGLALVRIPGRRVQERKPMRMRNAECGMRNEEGEEVRNAECGMRNEEGEEVRNAECGMRNEEGEEVRNAECGMRNEEGEEVRNAECGMRNEAEEEENHEVGTHIATPQEIIKLAAGAVIVPPTFQAKTQARKPRPNPQQFFTREEFAMVDELSELIIPTDEHSGGARAAKVAEYIDKSLAEAWEAEAKQKWR